MRRRRYKLQAHALAFSTIITEINDAAFLFLLGEGIGDGQQRPNFQGFRGVEKAAVGIYDNALASFAEATPVAVFPGNHHAYAHENARTAAIPSVPDG